MVFHAGCRYSFDGDLGYVARTSVRVLTEAGVDFGIFGKEETCCGGRAYHMGHKREFQQGHDNTLRKWSDAGVNTVVTPCADCYQTFKTAVCGGGR